MSDFHDAFQAFLSGTDQLKEQPEQQPPPQQQQQQRDEAKTDLTEPLANPPAGQPKEEELKGTSSSTVVSSSSSGVTPSAAAGPAQTNSPVPLRDETPSVPVKPIVPPIKLRSPTPPPPIPVIPIKPVKGKVYPPTYPPPDRPGRVTNQLLYIKRNIFSALWNHKFSWPFKKPVDAEKLHIPDYHNIVQQPMDLGTVKKRILNKYYWCAEECKKDIELIFFNCFLYNKPGQDIVLMGKELEKVYLRKLENMRMPEKEIGEKPAVARKRQQAVQPITLKRAFYAENQERKFVPKKIKPMDFESQIPLSTVGWPNHTKRSTNGDYSDSESDSETDSGSEDDRPTTGLNINRISSEGGVVGTPLSERKPIKHHCKYCSQPFISRYVRDMHEKQKHVLHNHSASSSFSSSSSFAERKVSGPPKPPAKNASSATATSKSEQGAGSGANNSSGTNSSSGANSSNGSGGAGKPPDKGLQIIPVSQGGVIRPLNSVGCGQEKVGGRSETEGGRAGHHHPHHPHQDQHIPHFVDKKHQAVHKQAQRNKAKNLQNVKQSLKAKQPLGTPPPLVHTNTLPNNGQKAAGSQKPGKSYNGNSSVGGAAATAALGKEPKQQQQQMPPSTNNSSSGSIPEELLFPMPEDFIKQDSEPFSPAGSEKGNMLFGAKQSPDSGYISSRGMPMVESPGFVGESCGGVPAGAPARDTNTLAEPFAMEFNKASVVATSYSLMPGVSMDPRNAAAGSMRLSGSAASVSASPRLSGGDDGSRRLSTSQMSRSTPDNRLMDLQEELGFVEPTFPRSLLENGTSTSMQQQRHPPQQQQQQQPQQQGRDIQKQSYDFNRSTMSKAASISSPVAAAVSPRGAGLDANPTSVGSQMVRLSRPGGGGGVGGLHAPPPVSSMGSYLGRGGGGRDNSSGRGPQFPAASFGMEQAVMQQPSRPVSLQTRISTEASRSPFSGGRAPPPSSEPARSPYSSGPRPSPGPSQPRPSSAAMDAASSGLGGAGGAAKMDVLAQTLKLSDLDFDQFEPEPSLIQDNQTQELKLEDLKHLREEPPVPLTAARGDTKLAMNGPDDLRDLLDFSAFSYSSFPTPAVSSAVFPASQPHTFQYGDASFAGSSTGNGGSDAVFGGAGGAGPNPALVAAGLDFEIHAGSFQSGGSSGAAAAGSKPEKPPGGGGAGSWWS